MRLGTIGEGMLGGGRRRPRQGHCGPGQLRCMRGAAKVLADRKAAGQQHHTQAALQQQATEARGRSGGASLASDRQQRARGPRIKPGVNFRRAGLADDNMDVSILGDLKLHAP